LKIKANHQKIERKEVEKPKLDTDNGKWKDGGSCDNKSLQCGEVILGTEVVTVHEQ